jgi:DUF971 family protein
MLAQQREVLVHPKRADCFDSHLTDWPIPVGACCERSQERKILDTATIPADIRALEIRPVGSYAVQISWSDGHSSGIYSWETLRRISGVDQRPAG